MEIIIKRLKALRESVGLSQNKLAQIHNFIKSLAQDGTNKHTGKGLSVKTQLICNFIM